MSEIEENQFHKLSEALSEEFPYGMMLDYCGIEFYVKFYSACDEFFLDFADNKNSKLWVFCEFYNKETKLFEEKSFFEEFVRNRMIVLNKDN